MVPQRSNISPLWCHHATFFDVVPSKHVSTQTTNEGIYKKNSGLEGQPMRLMVSVPVPSISFQNIATPQHVHPSPTSSFFSFQH